MMVSHYIYIYKIDLYSLVFTPNNSFATKIKNLDKHVAENWTPIKIQFNI